MRKFAFILLLIGLCLILAYCLFHPTKAWEDDMLRDTFFGEDYLSARGVADFPSPKLEGSYFDAEKNILYLNLSREEFDAYTNTVADYLRGNENLAVKGFHCGMDFQTLLILPLNVYQLASLDEGEMDFFHEDEHIFGFSTEEAEYEGYAGEYTLKNPKLVSVKWEPETKKSGASYTTVMKFPSFYGVEYLSCYHGHEMESITYPVAGTAHTTTISTCLRCGEKTREGYGYGNELKKFYWTVTKGTEYLVSGMSKQEHRGDLVEIATKTPAEGKLKMIANGKEIPAVRETETEQVFAFIMPNGNVNITIELAEPHKHTGEMHSGEEAHWYTFTCGCPSNEIAELHYDHNEDGLCDACEYVIQTQ